MLKVDQKVINEIVTILNSRKKISGLTHNFYNYPARFSPEFARRIIEVFTNHGDLIVDPFMGGGTTLVEAKYLGRNSIGYDINELSNFITRVKTTSLQENEIRQIQLWTKNIDEITNIHNRTEVPEFWLQNGYHKNLANNNTWRIRKFLSLAINSTEIFSTLNAKNFIRCAVLKTGQWALDNKKYLPNINDMRKKLNNTVLLMITGIKELEYYSKQQPHRGEVECYNAPAEEINLKGQKPKLILTSPPYPGVHVLYHRWQIMGRKETPAPYWIANCLDGKGEAFYTLGGRSKGSSEIYFSNIYKIFNSIRNNIDQDTIIVQLIAFTEPEWQLPAYNHELTRAGYHEIFSMDFRNKRMWRNVPNRKWYTLNKSEMNSSKEVVLFHKIS